MLHQRKMESSLRADRPITFLTSTAIPAVPAVAPSVPVTPPTVVQEVDCHNLEEEMHKISRLLVKYPFIAVDTEFPGTLDFPVGTFETCADYEYTLFKSNVDRMNIIQLGLSFFDENGNQPSPIHTWQFGFRFNLDDEMYAADSIKMLEESGIDFTQLQTTGIEPNHLAERLVTSGILCNDTVTFLTFHSAYDFGYLYKTLEGKGALPASEAGFLEVIRMYFPRVYDIKTMLKDYPKLKGGLQDLADSFRLFRTGKQHQAGSDSALTGALFFRLKRDVLPIRIEHFLGQIYGLSGVLALDRVRRIDNVIIRKNPDGTVHLPTAAHHGPPDSPVNFGTTYSYANSGLQSLSRPIYSPVPEWSHRSYISGYPSSAGLYAMAGARAGSSPTVMDDYAVYYPGVLAKSGLAQAPQMARMTANKPVSDGCSAYGHRGTVYFN